MRDEVNIALAGEPKRRARAARCAAAVALTLGAAASPALAGPLPSASARPPAPAAPVASAASSAPQAAAPQAAAPQAAAPQAAAPEAQAPAPASRPAPRVAPVSGERFGGNVVAVVGAPPNGMETMSLGEPLTLELGPGEVDALRARAFAKNQEIGLFVDGHYLKGVGPRPDTTSTDRLIFVPRYNDDNKDVWGSLFFKRRRLTEGLLVSVGFPDGEVARSTMRVRFHVLPPWEVGLSCMLALVLGVALWLAARSTALREHHDPAAPPHERAAFSLARLQMAWWTALGLWGFVFLYIITHGVQLNTSLVVLMGIGAVTALASSLIDARKAGEAAPEGAEPAPGAATPAAPPALSRGFFSDLVCDAHGVSLSRLQMVGWTVVLSAVFLHTVLTRLVLPEFDTTLLALMGVSSGTYLGFKLPQKKS
jgi:hypothetical protein